jgi:uncharacterized membrane protein
MKLELSNLLAILAMAVATYGTRLGGLWLLRTVRPTPALQAALDAVPVAVLTAVIAPSLVKGGPSDLAAAFVTIVAAARLPLLPAVAIGVASAVALRGLLVG